MAQITRAYQDGECDICDKKKPVRIIVKNKKYVSVCQECVAAIGDKSIDEVIKKYGKKRKVSVTK